MDNVIKITREQLFAMEHDYIRNFYEAAVDRIGKDAYDTESAEHDFFCAVEVITDFVDELAGDEANV
jgi:hypothetical protein